MTSTHLRYFDEPRVSMLGRRAGGVSFLIFSVGQWRGLGQDRPLICCLQDTACSWPSQPSPLSILEQLNTYTAGPLALQAPWTTQQVAIHVRTHGHLTSPAFSLPLPTHSLTPHHHLIPGVQRLAGVSAVKSIFKAKETNSSNSALLPLAQR